MMFSELLLIRTPVDALDLDSMIQISLIDKQRSSRLIGCHMGFRQLNRITLAIDNADEVSSYFER